ncbi:hypothetical protein [Bosea lathyri]|uniref:Uncharacterized protein n=1 Tax=Bosea lathyri TaxID=1036778 RepID=A0A1H5Z070_9HYPH|nr:hypothetical protein [Bosea lathyri]SEG29037.1 hypothetical protein SAMN04488115_104157 [Bosea lathyri]
MTHLAECGRARLKLRMPEARAQLERASSESFLDICEAYELAWVGLEHWTKSDASESSEMVAEYRELMASLELDAQFVAARDALNS